MRIFPLYFLALMLTVLAACSSDEDLTPLFGSYNDKDAPIISIGTPVVDGFYGLNQRMPIQLSVTDNVRLKSVQIRLFGDSFVGLNEIASSFSDYRSFDFRRSIDLADLDLGSYTLEVKAEDFDSNISNQKVSFEVLPYYNDNEVLLIVSNVPVGTEDQIYLIGDHQGNDPTTLSHPLIAFENGLYISIPESDLDTYNFVRGNSSSFIEKNAEGALVERSWDGEASVIYHDIIQWCDNLPSVLEIELSSCANGSTITDYFKDDQTVSVNVTGIQGSISSGEPVVEASVEILDPFMALINTIDLSLSGEVASGSFEVPSNSARGIYTLYVKLTDQSGLVSRTGLLKAVNIDACNGGPTLEEGFVRFYVSADASQEIWITGEVVGSWSQPGTGDSRQLAEFESGCYFVDIDEGILANRLTDEYKFFKGANWANPEIGLCGNGGNRTFSIANGERSLQHTISRFQF